MEDHTEVKVVVLDELELPNVGTLYDLEFEIEFIWVDKGWGAYEFWGATGVHESYSPYLVSSEYFGQEYIEEINKFMDSTDFENLVYEAL